jgi:flagellin-like protein
MKTLIKIKKNAKALSPVVASIILIAVTVAVSIAVAAWMGALTIGFMGTEEVKITNVAYANVTSETITVTLLNTGAGEVTINEIRVGSGDNLYTGDPFVLSPNAEVSQTVDFTWATGTSYMVKVISSKGNTFVHTSTAPV